MAASDKIKYKPWLDIYEKTWSVNNHTNTYKCTNVATNATINAVLKVSPSIYLNALSSGLLIFSIGNFGVQVPSISTTAQTSLLHTLTMELEPITDFPFEMPSSTMTTKYVLLDSIFYNLRSVNNIVNDMNPTTFNCTLTKKDSSYIFNITFAYRHVSMPTGSYYNQNVSVGAMVKLQNFL